MMMSVDFNIKVVAAFHVMLDGLPEVDNLTVSNYLLVFHFADTFDFFHAWDVEEGDRFGEE
jgi:hypothetical protein